MDAGSARPVDAQHKFAPPNANQRGSTGIYKLEWLTYKLEWVLANPQFPSHRLRSEEPHRALPKRLKQFRLFATRCDSKPTLTLGDDFKVSGGEVDGQFVRRHPHPSHRDPKHQYKDEGAI